MGAPNACTPRYFRDSHSPRHQINVGAKVANRTKNEKTITKPTIAVLDTVKVATQKYDKTNPRSTIPKAVSACSLKFYQRADHRSHSQNSNPVKTNLNNKRFSTAATAATRKDKKERVRYPKDSINDGKNYYNYYEPLQTDTMPKLVATTDDIPSISILTEAQGGKTAPPVPGQPDEADDGWTPVPSKKQGQPCIIINPYAKTLAPFTIPKGSSTFRDDDVPTKLRLPTSLRINPPKGQQVKYNISRIMAALLLGIQEVSDSASLGPLLQSDNDLPRINNIHQIPDEEELLLKYIDNPRAMKTGSFYANIVVHCDFEIHELKKNAKFRQWITNERIHLEYYPLRAATPMNVGFLYNIIPRDDTLKIQCGRLRNMLPEGCPDFHLVKQPLYMGKTKTMVLVMKADEPNIPLLAQLMNAVNKKRADIEYYPWDSYLALNRLQRLTIINSQNKFTSSFRTLMIHGFADDDDDIPMHYLEDNEENMQEDRAISPMETIGVTQYLRTVPRSGKGTLLFAYVFPPILGIREVLVTHANAAEAASYVRVATGELAREMNQDAIKLVFRKPEAAVEAMKQDKWMPFQRTDEIPEAVIMEHDNTNKVQPKRFRAPAPHHGFSYANAVRRQLHNQVTQASNNSTTVTDNSTDLTTHSKMEELERSNAYLVQKFGEMEKLMADMAESSNPDQVRNQIKEQLQLQAIELEAKFGKMVEEKFSQHSAELEKKMDKMVDSFNKKCASDLEQDRIDREAKEVARLEDVAFKAMLTQFVLDSKRNQEEVKLANQIRNEAMPTHSVKESIRIFEGATQAIQAESGVRPPSPIFSEDQGMTENLPGLPDSDSEYEPTSESDSEDEDTSMLGSLDLSVEITFPCTQEESAQPSINIDNFDGKSDEVQI